MNSSTIVMMMRRSLVYLLGCLYLLTSVNGLLSSNGVNFEVQALMDIKASLHDPHGVLDSWDRDAVDPCSWTMVTCSSDSFVIGLGTPSQSLSGTLSPSITNLTNLRIVLLQNNNITGKIPSEIGRLTRLETLDLSDNFFHGEIPFSLGHLRSLQYMKLNNNSLSGVIPLSLSNMTQLALLDLSYNNLSAPVPRFSSKTFSIVGNPLICPTGKEPDCNGTTLIPMSMNLNDTGAPLYTGRSKNHKMGIAVGASVGIVSMIFIAVGLFLWWRQRHNQNTFFDVKDGHYHEEVSLGNLRRFGFRELQIATNNFSSKNLLGKGGYGNVYKGILGDSTVVAVKRLKDGNALGGEIQFQTEVEMISLAVHRNLLRLYGFCITQAEKLLVYPYMSNGSVASRMKAKPVLDWSVRKRIAIGAARGLVYLHEQCDPKIIHRDVKAANILLDDYCEAVVGDFGLAKLLDHDDTHVTTAVRGTVGHIAPEYLSTGQSSEKTDVFGFGILLLELVTGQRALEFGKAANQKGAMLEWVRKIHQEKKLEVLVDKELVKNKHVLSTELQLYFQKIAELTMSKSSPALFKEALVSLASDSGLHPLVPYFTNFIADEVSRGLNDFQLLFNLMHVVRSLLQNPHIHIEPYLHQLMPSVVTCLVSRKLGNRFADNHWELRDFTAKLVSLICKRFGNTYHTLQSRLSKTLVNALLDPKKALTQHYGAIQGLTALGHNVVRLLILSNLEPYVSLLEPELDAEKQKNQMKNYEAWRVYGALLRAAGLCIHDRLKVFPNLPSPWPSLLHKGKGKIISAEPRKRKLSADSSQNQLPHKRLMTTTDGLRPQDHTGPAPMHVDKPMGKKGNESESRHQNEKERGKGRVITMKAILGQIWKDDLDSGRLLVKLHQLYGDRILPFIPSTEMSVFL